jgi:hypothetical protein
MAGGAFLELKELSLNRAHPGHQAVELREKLFLVLAGFLDEILGGAVANAVYSISQLSIQKPHMLLQIQELLVKLRLLEHGGDLA